MKDEITEYLKIRESSKAKSPKLRYSEGRFTAVVPEGLDVDKEEVIENNLEWFESYLSEARRYREQVPERRFEEGEVFEVLNEEKKVFVESRRSNKVDENIFLAEHLVSRTGLKDQLEKTLRSLAREKFKEKASKFVQRVEGDYEKIYIRDQKTRWGSCSSKNNLNFNWRLVLGPQKVLEYVVVHELVHLEIRNHSKRFENRVGEIFSEASEAKEWLNENSARLEFDPDL